MVRRSSPTRPCITRSGAHPTAARRETGRADVRAGSARCGGRGGTRFADIDWKKVAKRQLAPPYVPNVRADGDASNFDSYAEDKDLISRTVGPDPYKELFVDF